MGNTDILERLALTAPSSLDTATAIQRYLNGESMQVLAKQAGITPQGLYKRFKRFMLSYEGSEDAYVRLITQALVDRVADSDARLENAKNVVAIARAREQARFARMDLERRRPKLYGQKQQVDVDNRITVTVNKYCDIEAAPSIETPRPSSQVIDVNPQTIMDESQTPHE